MRKSKLKYISTRLVSNKSKSAFQDGAKRAMLANGYVVIASDGWVVKKFADGKIEKIEQLSDTQALKVILD
ncbi:MAG: hypothetical protein KA734_09335 [Fluviicola sp.]|nr:hypothetical protein [Fluviicola sp.]MBP6271455.1 hypothetical protein [Fluviicola sp.]